MIYVTCRSITTSDLADVVALDHRCLGGLWSEEAYRREINSPNSDLRLLELATTSDSPISAAVVIGIGCSWAILEEAHITLLGIDPAYQNRGLGQWLLIALLQAASDRGLTHATLEVRQSNAIAQQLYKKFGFKIAGERRKYYSDGENALILWKNGLQEREFTEFLQSQKKRLVEKLLPQAWILQEALISVKKS